MPIVFDDTTTVAPTPVVTFATAQELGGCFWNYPYVNNLDLCNYQDKELPRLPDCLNHLTITDGPNLGGLLDLNLDHLYSVKVAHCPELRGLRLSHRLVKLELIDCPKLSLPTMLPEDLKELHVEDCPIKEVPEFPQGFKQLRLTNCREITGVVTVPPTTRTILLHGCPSVYLEIAQPRN